MLNNSLAEQIIVNILTHELEITDPLHIWIRDQNRKIPPEKDLLYYVVGFVDGHVMAVTNTVVDDPDTGGMKEVRQVLMRDNIQIDIASRDDKAVINRWRVLAALRSVFSQQQQEKNFFKIFRVPTNFVNTSGSEGGSNLNKFSVTVACHVWYREEKALSSPDGDYYNEFKTRADTEQTIGNPDGIIDFTITEED